VAVAFRSSVNGVFSGGTLTLPKPTGLIVGDLMLACFAYFDTPPPAAGWVYLEGGAAGTSAAFWKLADATDVAASNLIFTGPFSVQGNNALAVYSGAGGIGSHASTSFGQNNPPYTDPSITVTDYRSFVATLVMPRGNAVIVNHPGFTQREMDTAEFGAYIDDQVFNPGPTGTSNVQLSMNNGCWIASIEITPPPMQITLQAVATFVPDATQFYKAEVIQQAAAILTPDGNASWGGNVVAQAVATVSGEASGTHKLDFTIYDAYIETPAVFQGLLFYDDPSPSLVRFGALARADPVTEGHQLQPVRSDVGNNPAEIRPEFGDIFAQIDFSHGSGQTYFHQAGRDPKRFFYSEGYDISEPGRLRHLRRVASAVSSATVGTSAQVAGLPFVADGTVVKRGDGALPGTWTSEDPRVAEAAQTVLSLAAEGARLFAALGSNGVHIRSSAGVWSHYQPDAATNLNINPAQLVAWVMNRLMVASTTQLFEVTASSTPVALETLAEGWIFTSIFEAGGFIHATAVNVNAALSRVYTYGLNSSATALERKSSTPLPIGELMWAGAGYLGVAFIGGGRVNSSGGYDPIFYKATIAPNGALDYTLVRYVSGAGASDLSVRTITPRGPTVLLSYSVGPGAYGGARDGIALYDLANNAFTYHLRKTGAAGGRQVLSILPFKGQVLISIASDGLYYEDLTTYYTPAILVTSLADWNNAGQKVWDQIELSHEALPAATSIAVDFTKQPQDSNVWALATTSAVVNSESAIARLSNTKSQTFALRLTSVAATTAPVFKAFSVRSHPSPVSPEYDIRRYLRILAVDRKDDQAEMVMFDPRAVLRSLQDAIFNWVTFYESGFTWTAFVLDVATVEPEQPFYDSASGDALKDAFIVRIDMIGTRSST
jgi:hypothetical protein